MHKAGFGPSLALVAALTLQASLSSAEIVVLRGGKSLDAVSYTVQGSSVIVNMRDGRILMYPVTVIDIEATKKQNAVTTQPPPTGVAKEGASAGSVAGVAGKRPLGLASDDDRQQPPVAAGVVVAPDGAPSGAAAAAPAPAAATPPAAAASTEVPQLSEAQQAALEVLDKEAASLGKKAEEFRLALASYDAGCYGTTTVKSEGTSIDPYTFEVHLINMEGKINNADTPECKSLTAKLNVLGTEIIQRRSAAKAKAIALLVPAYMINDVLRKHGVKP